MKTTHLWIGIVIVLLISNGQVYAQIMPGKRLIESCFSCSKVQKEVISQCTGAVSVDIQEKYPMMDRLVKKMQGDAMKWRQKSGFAGELIIQLGRAWCKKSKKQSVVSLCSISNMYLKGDDSPANI